MPAGSGPIAAPTARCRPRVALLLVAVGDLSSSGGAERQFSDLHAYMRESSLADVTLITARASVNRLREARRLQDSSRVIALPLGRRPAQGWLGVVWLTLAMLGVTVWHRFDIVHICLPTPSYVPFAALLSWLPKAVRPRLALNVIDCTLASNLQSDHVADLYERQVVAAHRLYFRWVRLDGVYTWYKAFATVCRQQQLLTMNVPVRAARYCFTDPDRYVPASRKENRVLYAGRFSAQKRPLLYVDAVAALRRRHPELVREWRFEMFGGGVLERDVRDRISQHGLDDVLSLRRTPDLSDAFARSRVFVSTQALENFTSLAMLEAMAAGNVIVAEDAGQTGEFVRAGENGFLVASATAESFADALSTCLTMDASHWNAMSSSSRRLATEVHSVGNFAEDIASFWCDVLDAQP